MRRLLLFVVQLFVVDALPWFGATPTPSPTPCHDGTSQIVASPTPPPSHHDLVKRDLNSNICGWVNGNENDPFTCNDPSATCLWSPDQKLVGCGNAQSMPFVTSCIDYTSASACDSACLANPSNFVCGSSAPYCRTVTFPSSYSMLPCGSVKDQKVQTIALTFHAVTTPIPLPRLLVNSTVDILTQLPPTTSSTSSPTSSPSTPPSLLDAGNPNKPATGSIIAAIVGGAVLLCGLPFGIKMFLRKRKWAKAMRPQRMREREERERDRQVYMNPVRSPYISQQRDRDRGLGVGRGVVQQQEVGADGNGGAGGGFLFSQDWYGRPGTGTGTGGGGQGNR